MDVHPPAEGLDQPRLLRKMSQDAQLDLRVVRGDENVPLPDRDQPLLDALRPMAEGRQVLEVRVPAAEPPRPGEGRLEGRVDNPTAELGRFPQGYDEAAEHLGELAMLQEKPRNPAVRKGRQPLQDGCTRGEGRLALGPGSAGKPQAVEQKLRDLFGGVQVDRLSRLLRDLPLDGGDARLQLGTKRLEPLEVQPNPCPLHRDQHGDQGKVELLHHRPEPLVTVYLGVEPPGRLQKPQSGRRLPRQGGQKGRGRVRGEVRMQQVVGRLQVPHAQRPERHAKAAHERFAVVREHRANAAGQEALQIGQPPLGKAPVRDGRLETGLRLPRILSPLQKDDPDHLGPHQGLEGDGRPADGRGFLLGPRPILLRVPNLSLQAFRELRKPQTRAE